MSEKTLEPIVALVKKDKTYSWCACGLSAKDPFCDGTHKTQSDLKSLKWTAPKDGEITFCGCKQTKNPPYCDGSHHLLKKAAHFVFAFILVLLTCIASVEAAQKKCNRSGRDSKFANFGKTAMPIATLGVNAFHLDWLGAIISQGMTHGLYAIGRESENKIGKRRPCGCNGAFPSGHMIVYGVNASFLHYRYGWQYGLPAYAMTIAFSVDRVRHKAHSWGDMIGTFAITNAIMYLITPRFTEDVKYLPDFSSEEKVTPKLKAQREPYTITPTSGPVNDGVGIGMSAKF